MNFNSASPKMKRSTAGRGGSGRGRTKTSQGPPQGQLPNLEGLYQNDRLVNCVTSVLGCPAKITGKSGKQFEGVFKTISPEGSLVLEKACKVEERQNGVVDSVLPRNDVFEKFVMNRKDWVRVEFKDVDLEECYVKKDLFKTDSAIVKKMNGQPRKELEKWIPSGDVDGSLETASLEDGHTMSNGWSAEEMFNVNQRKYGVKSTYNEDMEEYTTKLEKSDTPEYREKEKFAAQKAEEIVKESPYERNWDCGRSEETLYSSVVRNRYDRSTPMNWRNPHQDREQRSQKIPRERSNSPALAKKEPAKSPQLEEVPKIQVKEKVVKPVTETPVESKPERPIETDDAKVQPQENDDAVKGPKPALNTTPPKSQATATIPAGNQATPIASAEAPKDPEAPEDPAPVASPATPKSRNDPVYEDLKSFGTNFVLADKKPKESGTKVKKATQNDEKITNEKKKEEKEKDSQTPQEMQAEAENTSVEKNAKSTLNPNATEFRPVKRSTPSPCSASTPSSGGAPSPYPTPISPYPMQPFHPGNVYSRPRGRGPRNDFVEHPNFMSASNAAGQPLFAQPFPQIVPQPQPPGMYVRHPGLPPHHVFMSPGQPTVMVPMGQMGATPYPDGFYYGPPGPMPMLQSPPQITSPSLQQSQFNFSSTSLPPQPVNTVRHVSNPVMSQQPQQPVVLVRPTTPLNPEMQQTPIIASRPPQAPNYQGN